MRFEWDPAKASSNLAKHGVEFGEAIAIWAGRVVEFDTGHSSEPRVVALGATDGVVLAVVYTPRGDVRRIISAPFASRQERRRYAEAE